MVLDRPLAGDTGQIAVEVHDLTRTFGDFTAVESCEFRGPQRRDLWACSGPNGAGKSTTFRMLCGLLPASGGTLRVAGADLRTSRAEARQRLGYVAQKFSLYGQLSVDENLEFFASAYGLRGARKRQRIAWAQAAIRTRQVCRPSERATARRFQAAPRHGGGTSPRTRNPLSRRGDERRRPDGAAGILGTHHVAVRTGRHGDRHHAFHGRGGILRPRHHPRCGRRSG